MTRSAAIAAIVRRKARILGADNSQRSDAVCAALAAYLNGHSAARSIRMGVESAAKSVDG